MAISPRSCGQSKPAFVHSERYRMRPLIGRFICTLALLAGLGQGFLVAPASAQERVESLILREFPMVNQPARHALPLVDPLLSTAGTVSFEQDKNALVIRDRASVLDKLRPVLADFDHPIQELVLELHLLRASRRDPNVAPATNSPPADQQRSLALPKALATDLASILSLNNYEVLGFIKLVVKEGEVITSKIGPRHEFSFDVGTVLRHRYLKLADFRVLGPAKDARSRQAGEGSAAQPVLRSTGVNLEFERPAFITVSRDANSASGLVMAFLWSPVPSTGVSPPRPTATRPAPKVGDR